MMTFRDHRLRDLAEAKGKQELYTRQSPQMLKALREMALVQSVESSNRIEGVTVAPDRLRPLVLGNARPKDRSEQDIAGYRIKKIAFRAQAWRRVPLVLWHLRLRYCGIRGGIGPVVRCHCELSRPGFLL